MRFAGIVLVAFLLGSGVRGETFRFAAFERDYADIEVPVQPVEVGGMVVRVSSPENLVTIRRLEVDLAPRGDVHEARLALELLGRGRLVADLEILGQVSRLEDRVVIPYQRFDVSGAVRLALRPEGLEVTVVELPPTLRVAFSSDVAGGVLEACRGLSLGLLGLIDCDPLETGLSVADVSLPGPGTTVVVSTAELAPELRAALGSYLDPGTSRPPGRVD